MNENVKIEGLYGLGLLEYRDHGFESHTKHFFFVVLSCLGRDLFGGGDSLQRDPARRVRIHIERIVLLDPCVNFGRVYCDFLVYIFYSSIF
jgi:hypothetical protein